MPEPFKFEVRDRVRFKKRPNKNIHIILNQKRTSTERNYYLIVEEKKIPGKHHPSLHYYEDELEKACRLNRRK